MLYTTIYALHVDNNQFDFFWKICKETSTHLRQLYVKSSKTTPIKKEMFDDIYSNEMVYVSDS